MLLARILLIVIFCYQNVQCSKKTPCDLDNTECIMAAAKRITVLKSATPLHLDLIEANLATVKYTVSNTTLYGIDKCYTDFLSMHSIDKTYVYHVACKHLIMDGFYDINGELGPMPIKGKGDFKVEYTDYVFIFTGEYDQFSDENGKVHNQAKNFKLDIDARGNVLYDFKNLFDGDTEKAAAIQKYVRENWQEVNKILRQPVMEKFMAQFIDRVNAFLAKIPIEDLFTEE